MTIPATYCTKRCPDCGYFVSPVEWGLYRCYNCDEDLGEDELVDVWGDPVKPGLVVLRPQPQPQRGDDDESPTVYIDDDQSLSATLKEGNVLTSPTPPTPEKQIPLFPYTLDDILYWVVKRKTGEIVKYSLIDTPGVPGHRSEKESKALTVVGGTSRTTSLTQSSYSDWCNHNPTADPVWEGPPDAPSDAPSSSLRLFIADAQGMRNHKDEFDIVIDAGDVLSDSYAARGNTTLIGAKTLTEGMEEHILGLVTGPQILKITWADRKAPPLLPSFWPVLASRLEGDVLANCIGGHGRSGTILVCLMLALNPEYSAADAIIHLRAMHCPRAIESWEQHDYIDQVAAYLGRKANAKDVHDIKNFKAAFLALTHPSAKPYQDRLKAK